MSVKMTPDTTLIEQTFSRGTVRDVSRHLIPAGGVYDSTDFLCERPGMLYKRGGWERLSAALGASTSVAAVATIHVPTRVVAVGSDGILYDVTSENSPQADAVGLCPAPGENPPLYAGTFLVFCFPDASAGPKKVYTTGGGGTVTLDDLGGTPPPAAHSTVYAGRIVLARGPTGGSPPLNLNRLWFSPLPDVEATWDTTNSYIDVTNEITALAVIQGVLLIFSPTGYERILGGVPPGIVDDAGNEITDMDLQPVEGAVGCIDGRSIAYYGGEVVFAGEQGVYATNGGGPRSLTEKPDGSGIQTYWRTLFPAGAVRQVCGGILLRDFYKVDVLDASNTPLAVLLCHLPTLAWAPLSLNCAGRSMAVGRTEQETLELYMASASEGYVEKLVPILFPTSGNTADGDGAAVEPTVTFRTLQEGPYLKAWGDSRLNFMVDSDTGASLAVATAKGILAPAFTTRKTLAQTDGEVARKRFDLFFDSEACTVKVTQSGESATTELYALEVETRPYDPSSEGV